MLGSGFLNMTRLNSKFFHCNGRKPDDKLIATQFFWWRGMGNPSDDAQVFPFEESLKQLEDLVERLESGEVSLEESLQDFESGVALVRTLRERLDQAQQRVDKIVEQEGGETAAQTHGPHGTMDDEDKDD